MTNNPTAESYKSIENQRIELALVNNDFIGRYAHLMMECLKEVLPDAPEFIVTIKVSPENK